MYFSQKIFHLEILTPVIINTIIMVSECETQPSCFLKTFKLGRVLNSSDTACTICLWMHPNSRFEVISSMTSFDTCFTTCEPYTTFPSSTTQINCTKESSYENGVIRTSLMKLDS